MIHPVLGLHHVTATADDAQADLDFCLGLLGLRLVKKTVNFDNRNVYHFYYGSELGTPGTIWTTFPYRGWGVPRGARGAGQVVSTSFSVPTGTLGFWRRRFEEGGVDAHDVVTDVGEPAVRVVDPSGLHFDLVGDDRDTRAPWTGGGVGSGEAIRGLHSVTLVVRSLQGTLDLLTALLGFALVDEGDGWARAAVGGDAPGHLVDIVVDPRAGLGVNGLGTVHHVAWAISNDDEQRRLREELLRRGLLVTDVRDRCYFKSIYFREPGGVLFEVATVAPGFTVDEEAASLGRDLKLPPWEEAHRPSIVAGLPPVEHP